jgi:hypothetical protein
MAALEGENLIAFHNYMVSIVPTVVSVSVPDTEDRSTWVVQCEPEATPEQQAQITEAIQGYTL